MFGGTWFPLIGSLLVVIASAVRIALRVPWRRVLLEAVFVGYVLFAIDMSLLPVRFDAVMREMYLSSWPYWQQSVNFVPLRTVVAQLSADAPPTAVFQLFGNLALLIPLGVLAPLVIPRLRNLRAFLAFALSVAVGIELLQLLQKVALIGWRSIDIDDVILNTAGALLGFGVWRLVAVVRSRFADGAAEDARLLPDPGVNQTTPCEVDSGRDRA
ncbi:MAG: VanZ family protein [Clostridiales bacterium]|nr:VanZ family protein [Clostridiales bacterium]